MNIYDLELRIADLEVGNRSLINPKSEIQNPKYSLRSL
jgi:hypothetical protein